MWDLFRTGKVLKVVSGQILLEMLAATKANNGSYGVDVAMVGTTGMPKIIHQSWKTADVPGVYGELQKTWRETYPDWLHVLWTDEDNDNLVKNHHAEWLGIYKALKSGVCRADMVRNMYMYSFGGMYVDLDFDSYKTMEPFFIQELKDKKNAAFMGRMAEPEPVIKNFNLHTMPNAWFASTSGHAFWQDVLNNTKLAWDKNEYVYNGWHARDKPEYVTGPVVLQRTYKEYTSEDKKNSPKQLANPIVVLPPALLYSFPWYPTKDSKGKDMAQTLKDGKVGFDLEKMRKKFNNGITYACTYWGASWQSNGWKPQKVEKVVVVNETKLAIVEQEHVFRISREYDALR